jgi:ADP-heptose:LPS heptosyltransferase
VSSKILLIRLRLIGDVVFTTPAVRAIRQQFPDAHLTYVVEEAAAPVLEGNPHLDEVVVLKRSGGLRQLAGDVALARRLRSARYDVVVDFHGGPRSSLLAWLCGAPVRIGYAVVGRSWMYTLRIPRSRELRPRHSVENQWDLLAAFHIPPPTPSTFPVEMAADPRARAVVSARLEAAGVHAGHRLIVAHVSANSTFRRWPRDSFAETVATLAAASADRRVIVTSGPSESDAVDHVVRGAWRRLGDAQADRVLQCGEFSIAELRALLDQAALYIGGDTGPLHVASTTRIPIVGIFGSTLPVRSGPWRSTADVTEAVDVGPLPCRPCDQRVCAPGDFRCLTWLEPVRVVAAAERALALAGMAEPVPALSDV